MVLRGTAAAAGCVAAALRAALRAGVHAACAEHAGSGAAAVLQLLQPASSGGALFPGGAAAGRAGRPRELHSRHAWFLHVVPCRVYMVYAHVYTMCRTAAMPRWRRAVLLICSSLALSVAALRCIHTMAGRVAFDWWNEPGTRQLRALYPISYTIYSPGACPIPYTLYHILARCVPYTR